MFIKIGVRLNLFIIGAFIMANFLPALNTQMVNAAGTVIRVAADGSSNDPSCGLTWDMPCNLEYALSSRTVENDEIWVKTGTYTPSGINDANKSFHLTSGVGLYGGFSGIETSREQRNWVDHPTYLTGLHGNPHPYYVLMSSFASEFTVLDGFTVSGDCGIQVDHGFLTLRHMTIRDNNQVGDGWGLANNGGGLENNGGAVTIEDAQFIDNLAYNGGAVYSSSGSLSIKDTLFQDNAAPGGYGGAIWILEHTNLTLENTSFIGNSARMGGAIFSDEGTVLITNSVFTGNTTTVLGGTIANAFGSVTTIISSTFRDNTGIGPGVSIYTWQGFSLVVRNSILWETQSAPIYDYGGSSIAQVAYSDIKGGYAGVGNIDSDPGFGSVGNYGGMTPVIPISESSPAKDAVPEELCTRADGSSLSADQRGIQRPQDFGCDMGSFEVEDTQVNLIRNSLVTLKVNMPVVITREELRITYRDVPPEDLSYTFSQLPTLGRLRLDGADLQINDTFTQKDIDDGKLVYYNDSGLPGPDGFGFLFSAPGQPAIERVSVGSGGQQARLRIQVDSRNPAPEIKINNGLSIQNGLIKTISPEQILASSGLPAVNTVFTLTGIPQNGSLTLDHQPLQVGNTFTQEDINQGKLAFHATQPGNDEFAFALGYKPLIQGISVGPDGQVNPDSYFWYPSISYDGRYTPITFAEENKAVIFIRDLETHQYERIAPGFYANISGNGRYVLFLSSDGNIIPGVPSSQIGPHLYRYDRVIKTFEIIDVDSNGISSPDGVGDCIGISFDGQEILFVSRSALLPASPDGSTYVRHMRTGELELVSINAGNHPITPYWSSISGDGRYVVFENYVRDLKTKITTQTLLSPGDQFPSISYDGRFITSTIDDGVLSGDTNGFSDIALYDQTLNSYSLISVTDTGDSANGPSFLPSISPDGRYVSFSTGATNLSGSGNPSIAQVIYHDRLTSENKTVSLSAGGEYGNDHSAYTALPSGGQSIIFSSRSSNLVPGENEYHGQFLVDLTCNFGSFEVTVDPEWQLLMPIISR